jgi:hypothetical protein
MIARNSTPMTETAWRAILSELIITRLFIGRYPHAHANTATLSPGSSALSVLVFSELLELRSEPAPDLGQFARWCLHERGSSRSLGSSPG